MARPDLNLFAIFDVIMQEQSVTAAAERLAMTQPSVSNAVARMRHHWRDPLFVKQGRGLRPTPFAIELWRSIAGPLEQIAQAVTPAHFVPSQARARFRIALTDGMTALLWLPLRQIIEQQAPGIDIHAVPYKADGEALLLNAEVDLVLDYYPGSSAQIRTRPMFNNHFACVMSASHGLAGEAMTLERFLAAEHLLVSLSGDAQGIVDSCLRQQGRARRIAMTVNSFAGALHLIRDTRLITVLPYPIVAQAHLAGDLVVKPVPLAVPPAAITLAWHCRDDHSPGLVWLRDTLAGIIEARRALLETRI
ncbi:transcriptional regulator [Marinobacterium aestuarii]|uniref:Transcriptional regulator n=1 Tax=Marinobacterium aestuarii TaxID=1821621 RepID=A0A1A9F0B6_9GAMM|nr:LysR family transcriptional regulator [Marinobacterium aestuarii]ANG63440.1 transcriptional regulator [Marinobacterium aestuarii]